MAASSLNVRTATDASAGASRPQAAQPGTGPVSATAQARPSSTAMPAPAARTARPGRTAAPRAAGSPAAATKPGRCSIKGNINREGEKIYHVPGSKYYDDTVITPDTGERWFCSVDEAVMAGWRAPRG